MLSPPVPLNLVKSPPYIMKLGITLWKMLSLNDNFFPDILLLPASPVQSYLKFSAVLGTIFLNNSITILPAFSSPIFKSKYTLGFDGALPET